MTSKEFYTQLEIVAEEKGLSLEQLLDAFEKGLINGYKKEFGNSSVRVEFNVEKHTINMYSRRIVVSSLEDRDPESEILPITLTEAKKISRKAKVGDILEEAVNIKDFGRLAAGQVKNILNQNIKTYEKENTYQYFKSLENEMIGATVIGIDEKHDNQLVLSIGNGISTLLPRKELLKSDEVNVGDHINVYVSAVELTTKGPKVYVSRNDKHFVIRLLEQYVSEIHDGIIEIKGIARDAGDRCKIALKSNDPNVEAIGSAVGRDGSRIKDVNNALGGEKIDLYEWSDDPKTLVANALKPAEVIAVINVDPITKTSLAIVPDDQLSLAIGKKGQNVRLAVQSSGWKIDIKTESIAREQGYEWDE